MTSVRFLGINVARIDGHELQALPLVDDVKRVLGALRGALKNAGYAGTGSEYRDQIGEKKREWDALVTDLRTVKADTPGKLAETAVIGVVNEAFWGKTTVVCAGGGMPRELQRLLGPADPEGYHTG